MWKNWRIDTISSKTCRRLISKLGPFHNLAKRKTHSGIHLSMFWLEGLSSQPRLYLIYLTMRQLFPSSERRTIAAKLQWTWSPRTRLARGTCARKWMNKKLSLSPRSWWTNHSITMWWFSQPPSPIIMKTFMWSTRSKRMRKNQRLLRPNKSQRKPETPSLTIRNCISLTKLMISSSTTSAPRELSLRSMPSNWWTNRKNKWLCPIKFNSHSKTRKNHWNQFPRFPLQLRQLRQQRRQFKNKNQWVRQSSQCRLQ